MATIIGEQALRFTCSIKVCTVERNWDKFILFRQDHEQGGRRNLIDKCPCVKRCHVFDGAYCDGIVVGWKLPLCLLKPGEPTWANDGCLAFRRGEANLVWCFAGTHMLALLLHQVKERLYGFGRKGVGHIVPE